jgi:hypothetical protein
MTQTAFSAVKPSAKIYISTAAATSGLGVTFIKVPGTYTPDGLDRFSHSAGVLTYTGDETRTFNVNVVLSCSPASAGVVLAFRVAKNGTSRASTEIRRQLSTGNDIGAVALVDRVSLAKNETLEIQVSRVSGAGELTVDHMAVVVSE